MEWATNWLSGCQHVHQHVGHHNAMSSQLFVRFQRRWQNGNLKVWPTYGRTDRLTGVGARDTCVSKKYQEEIYCSRLENLYCNRLSLQLVKVIWNKSHRLRTDGPGYIGARNACAFKSASISPKSPVEFAGIILKMFQLTVRHRWRWREVSWLGPR